MLYIISNRFYNAGHLPAKIIRENPFLVHGVWPNFGVEFRNLAYNLYRNIWSKWNEYDTIHTLVNHRYYLDRNSPISEFDEYNIIEYDYTYGYMARDIMNRIKKI